MGSAERRAIGGGSDRPLGLEDGVGLDRLVEAEFVVPDRVDHHALGRVSRRPHRDRAGDAGKIAGRGDRVADLRLVGRAGPEDGVEGDVGGVVAEGGDRVGRGDVEFLLVELAEGADSLVGLVGGERGGVEIPLDARPSDGEQLLRVPAVAADERHVDPHRPGLAGDAGEVVVHRRDQDRGRLRLGDRGELGLEILVAVAIGPLHRHLAAHPQVERLEFLGEADRIVIALVDEHRDPPGFQRVEREQGGGAALVGVGEADPEDIFAFLRDRDRGRRRRDHRDAPLVAERRADERKCARNFADDEVDLAPIDQRQDARQHLVRGSTDRPR